MCILELTFGLPNINFKLVLDCLELIRIEVFKLVVVEFSPFSRHLSDCISVGSSCPNLRSRISRHDYIQLNIYLTARIENKYLKSQNVIGSHHLYMNILFTRVAEYNDIYQKGIWGSMVCSKLLMGTNSVYTHD